MQLKKSSFNVLEPSSNEFVCEKILDTVFIPALCCDINKNRLGYGCGFYDRFLKKLNSNTNKIIVTSEEMCFKKIPTNDFDEKADFIITEENVL